MTGLVCSTAVLAVWSFVSVLLTSPAGGHLCVTDPPQRVAVSGEPNNYYDCYDYTGPCGEKFDASPPHPTPIQSGSNIVLQLYTPVTHFTPGKQGYFVVNLRPSTSDGEFTRLKVAPDQDGYRHTLSVQMPDGEGSFVLQVVHVPYQYIPFYSCSDVILLNNVPQSNRVSEVHTNLSAPVLEETLLKPKVPGADIDTDLDIDTSLDLDTPLYPDPHINNNFDTPPANPDRDLRLDLNSKPDSNSNFGLQEPYIDSPAIEPPASGFNARRESFPGTDMSTSGYHNIENIACMNSQCLIIWNYVALLILVIFYRLF